MTLENLKIIRQEYWAEIHGQAGDRPIDWDAIEQNERLKSFYDYLLARGWNRWQLSARGIGRDVPDATRGMGALKSEL